MVPGNAETSYLGPNGFGQGLPPIKALGKILNEIGKDRISTMIELFKRSTVCVYFGNASEILNEIPPTERP